MPDIETDSGAAGAGSAFVPLGRFPVEADREAVADYRLATALAGSDIIPEDVRVPPLFPVIWLGRPDVRDAVYAVLGEDRLPVQTGYRMIFGSDVAEGGRYVMSLGYRALADDRFEFAAIVEAPDAIRVAEMHIEILMIGDGAGGP